jgi:hypothetical protein
LIALIALPFASEAPATADVAEGFASAASSKSRPFSHVLIRPLRFEYTPEFLADDAHGKKRSRVEDLQRIQRYYYEIVEKKLTPDFERASVSGPGVALVEGVLVDFQIDKTDWSEPTQLTFRGAPEVQIVAYLHDSETGDAIDTIGLTFRPQPMRLMKSGTGFYWDFMRRVIDRLATRVRWSLEDRNSQP